ncbi:Protein SMG7 [Acorus gramineus]|uniref:Protein SMG7 n=1 Tax=Acorus gramineus TaxID=55184 RepID=A0AAV9BIE0_ACOGR|nr:Protein SMG7 [Acorus gramineus]
MMTLPMDSTPAPSSRDLVQNLYKKNRELENGLRRAVQSKIPSDPNTWIQMRENYETIILEDHDFSELHEVEYALWQLHYKRIEEFRAHINNSPSSAGLVMSQGGRSPARPERVRKILSIFKGFLSEATGFYHGLILKIRARYGLPLGFLSDGVEGQIVMGKDEKKSGEMKKGLMSCHRCMIYLGDLARYKGLYGEGDSVSCEYAAASSYYIQASCMWPSSGNPHHQLAILASYSGDDLVAIYRYFRSLATETPFSTARDNLIIAFEKNRQIYSQLPANIKISKMKTTTGQMNGKGRGRGHTKIFAKDSEVESDSFKEVEPSISENYKAFSTRFVRLNGILFTRTSLETFGEIFSAIISDLYELLSSGLEEKFNFGSNATDNGLAIVRLVTVLIFTVHNVKRESESQSYAEILQRTVLLQNAFIAAFEFVGHIIKLCAQIRDVSSSYLLPAILVFIEWLACYPDIAAGMDVDEKQASARLFFWSQCVSFLNNLILSGSLPIDDDEDDSCFTDMSQYDESETGNRCALWEDFELRGFLPLAPAHLILDFSRKHSFGNDDGDKEKRARVQRIFAAGRALVNVVQSEQGIYFDQKLKKFAIGIEPQDLEDDILTLDVPSSNAQKQSPPVDDLGVMPPVAQMYMDEEEGEEIVFKPSALPQHPGFTMPNSTTSEIVQPILPMSAIVEHHPDVTMAKSISSEVFKPSIPATSNFSSYMTAFSAPLNNGHFQNTLSGSPQLTSVGLHPPQQITPTSKWFMKQDIHLADALKHMRVVENGYDSKSGFAVDMASIQPPSTISHMLPPSAYPINVGMSHYLTGAEPLVPSRLDSVVPSVALSTKVSPLPTGPSQNPVSRPVRHFGPPPGFCAVSSKQQEEPINGRAMMDDQSLEDDYSWLDGYQFSSTTGTGTEKSLAHMPELAPQIPAKSNNMAGMISFPFPGKQIPTMQAQVDHGKRPLDSQFIDNRKFYTEQQLYQEPQLDTLPGQYQGQSLWAGRYFV